LGMRPDARATQAWVCVRYREREGHVSHTEWLRQHHGEINSEPGLSTKLWGPLPSKVHTAQGFWGQEQAAVGPPEL
jgi:hypothetical protein